MACIALAVFGSQAQIKVHSDNRVSLGSTNMNCPSQYKTYHDGSTYINGGALINSNATINGNTLINGSLTTQTILFNSTYPAIWGPFYVDGCNYNPLIFKEDDGQDMGLFPLGSSISCSLGASDAKFAKIYTYEAFYNFNYNLSDKRKKENIQSIEKPLTKLLQVKGYKYDFITENLDSIKSPKRKAEIEASNKNHLGFLAQDLQQIIPEAVKYDEADDTYYIDYNAMIPVLVEAIKELSAQIDELKKETINEKSAVIGSSTTPDGSEAATLAQNIPNPFSSTTRIDIYLPASVTKAMLYVYTMQGAQVKSIPVTGRGNTHVTLDGFTLDAGMYLYTLIADGKEVDTKKMILTK